MNKLERRVKALEAKEPENNTPYICYVYDEGDSEGEAAAKAEAVADWEAENGPLGERVPSFIPIRQPVDKRLGRMPLQVVHFSGKERPKNFVLLPKVCETVEEWQKRHAPKTVQ